MYDFDTITATERDTYEADDAYVADVIAAAHRLAWS